MALCYVLGNAVCPSVFRPLTPIFRVTRYLFIQWRDFNETLHIYSGHCFKSFQGQKSMGKLITVE